MADQPITLHIPEHIYDRARQIADTTGQPIEAVLLRELENAFLPPLPSEEQAELNALKQLSDAALWTIAREQMPAALQERMQTLMDGNTNGSLSEAESQELAQLVEQSQQLMLRKGKAAALLTERGHQITRQALRE
jgi:hypothetical protein